MKTYSAEILWRVISFYLFKAEASTLFPENTIVVQAILPLLQLLISAPAAPKQTQTVYKPVGLAVSQ